MMLPVSWQIGWDFCFASSIFFSMIFIADSAIVPFFSRSKEARIAACTSSGISAEVRRISSSIESCSAFMTRSRYGFPNGVSTCRTPGVPLSSGVCAVARRDRIGEALLLIWLQRDQELDFLCVDFFVFGHAFDGPVAAEVAADVAERVDL